MNANDVRPQKWLWNDNYPIRVLFDDGEYSVIWGQFEHTRALGTRWNGGADTGYPSQGANPTWYVEPDFIALSILQRLLTMAIETKDTKYINNILFAINELTNKMNTT